MSDILYIEQDARRALIGGITDGLSPTLIKPTALDVLVVGNLTSEKAETFSRRLKTRLGLTGTDWRRADKATGARPL